MGLTRRQAIFASLGTIALSGCASTGSQASRRPAPPWQGYPATPSSRKVYTPVEPVYQPPAGRHEVVTPKATAIDAITRTTWASKGPIRSKVNKMGRVNKITIHHEGWTPVYFTGKSTTAERIEKIRKYHTGPDRRWGDIGYHFIVDRAGRVWEGRPIAYQGAHVSKNNEQNVGILVMGNFEKQSPSEAQLQALFKATKQLKVKYGVKASLVRSHQEINPTTCPGKNLQRRMNALRRHVG